MQWNSPPSTGSTVFSKLSQEIVQRFPETVQRVWDEENWIRHSDELQLPPNELSLLSVRDILCSQSAREHVPKTGTARATSKKLTKLQNSDDIFLVAENLAQLLSGSRTSFANFLNDVTEIFLSVSSSNAKLPRLLLYVLYDCFHAAYDRVLFDKAGLLLCAIAVVEGASVLVGRINKQRTILFHDEAFRREMFRLASVGHVEFG